MVVGVAYWVGDWWGVGGGFVAYSVSVAYSSSGWRIWGASVAYFPLGRVGCAECQATDSRVVLPMVRYCAKSPV